MLVLSLYALTLVSTILLSAVLQSNAVAFVRLAADLLRVSAVIHLALMFGAIGWALYRLNRGGWSFIRRIGPFTVRGVSRIPPAPPCMARPRRRRGGKPCSR